MALFSAACTFGAAEVIRELAAATFPVFFKKSRRLPGCLLVVIVNPGADSVLNALMKMGVSSYLVTENLFVKPNSSSGSLCSGAALLHLRLFFFFRGLNERTHHSKSTLNASVWYQMLWR